MQHRHCCIVLLNAAHVSRVAEASPNLAILNFIEEVCTTCVIMLNVVPVLHIGIFLTIEVWGMGGTVVLEVYVEIVYLDYTITPRQT